MTNTTKHTPGPWAIDTNTTDVVTADCDGLPVAYLACAEDESLDGQDGERFTTEVEANARLIAAAPELYEALKTLREDIRMLRDGEWDGGEEGCDASLEYADTALAKADGA